MVGAETMDLDKKSPMGGAGEGHGKVGDVLSLARSLRLGLFLSF